MPSLLCTRAERYGQATALQARSKTTVCAADHVQGLYSG